MVTALKIPVRFHPPKVADFHMIASAYPQVTFIMAHLGSFASQNWSEHLAAIDIARRYPNVYLETSSVILWRYLEMAAREVPEKLIFGGDGPDGDSRVEIHKIRLMKLPRDVQRKVLGPTVQRLVPSGVGHGLRSVNYLLPINPWLRITYSRFDRRQLPPFQVVRPRIAPNRCDFRSMPRSSPRSS